MGVDMSHLTYFLLSLGQLRKQLQFKKSAIALFRAEKLHLSVLDIIALFINNGRIFLKLDIDLIFSIN